MPERIPQSVAIRVPIQAYLSSDHISPATGKTIAITISKNGAAYANPSGGATNATEIGSGSYYVDLSTTDTGTTGPLFVKGTEGTIDNIIAIYNVVDAHNAGFDGVPAVAAAASGGLIINGSNTGTVTLAALTCTGAFTISDGLIVNAVTTNRSAVTLTGVGTGSGLRSTGGLTGAGIFAIGGGTSGPGFQAQATTNSNGIVASGAGIGSGLVCTSGSTGGASTAGILALGSGGNSYGIAASGSGTSHGIYGASGSGATGDGIHGASSATNGNGIRGLGAGTGDGLHANGGATGRGIHAVGGATSGAGFRVEGTNGNANALELDGHNTGAGLSADSLSITGATTLTGTVLATDASNDIRGVLLQATQTGVTIPTVTTVGTVNALAANSVNASALAADAVAEIADGVWDEDATAHQTQGTFGQVIGDSGADTDSIWSLANTNLDAAVSSRMATYTQPTGFLAATFPSGTIANTTNITAGTITTVSGNVNGSVGSVVGDIGGLAAGAITDVENAVWDTVLASHLTAGSTGFALNAAGSAGDPWGTALPGAYGSGTAGFILGTNLNATVSSRASQTSVDDLPTNAEFASAMALLSTSAQLVKVLAAVYDTATGSGGDTLTLSNGATQVINTSTGTRTTTG